MRVKSVPTQPDNPTDLQRHELLRYGLKNVNRLEDFNNVIELLSPPSNITSIASSGRFKGVKVGIIGGGLAGLSSAFELRKLGFDTTIFEASENRIGGRVYTYYFDEDKKLYGELGAMRIPVSHETTWHYINLFNLNTRPFVQTNKNAFLYVRDIRVRNDPKGKNVMESIYPEFKLKPWERNTPWQELIEYGLGTPLASINPKLRREILQVKPKYSYPIQYWTYYNTRQVFEIMKLSQGALNLLGSISPFIGSFYYNSYSEILQEEYPVDFTFLYEIIGGMVNLPLAFYKSLISENPDEYKNISNNDLGKVIWNAGKLVTAINKSEKGDKVVLKYKDKSSTENLQETFDYVICAIPFSSLRNVNIDPFFSTRKMQSIKEVNYTNAQRTLFLCNKRFWEEQGIIGGGSYTDLPITSIWYPSDHAKCIPDDNRIVCFGESPFDNWGPRINCSPNDPGVFLASYNFSLDAVRLGNLSDKLHFKEVKEQVEAVHGLKKEYLDSVIKDYETIQWNEEEGFYGAFAYFYPEQKRIFSYAMVKPEYNNTVFFAGEHTSTKHAWQQGALNSGMKAANSLARYCKIHKG
ncbi:flavin monoamine oxidase family protein [Tepidibacter hydrothermalis]|uniref:FAD-dependent oxidoreductase n=1 Tax=Tepidibacter hydrothermalis TaxID=3036126 RepID=A0ABY8E928_9FIRM|nr:FAD-dependent oxidoreductase [Tepidibacter hydrothermalis]WFD09410.1 FAD-dependent oxidoreductase [Tepidibacter hydrothermalis]